MPYFSLTQLRFAYAQQSMLSPQALALRLAKLNTKKIGALCRLDEANGQRTCQRRPGLSSSGLTYVPHKEFPENNLFF
eukprot:605724-Pelagomonas_calceolata.AAC.5